ncbi:hypothetical protein [Spirochaeta dissipatitropha]
MRFFNSAVRGMFALLVLFFLAAMLSCATAGSADGAIDDAAEPEIASSFIHNEIFMVSRVDGTHSVDPDSKIEVLLSVENLSGYEGVEIAAVGHELNDGKSTFTWNNNPNSENLSAVVSDGSADFIFYFNTANDSTDFKIFVKNSWNEVITDPQEGDGNIRIVLDDLVSVGQRVSVIVDASSFGTE